MISPMIKTAIENSVSSAVESMKSTVLDKLVESNDKLQKTVADQMEVIKDQRAELDDKSNLIENNAEDIKCLKMQILTLTDELKTVKVANNELEQYGRRNSIRISNLHFDPKLSESELTKHVVGFLNKSVLPGGSPIQESDVERCHPIGRPGPRGNRQILVKFGRYHVKHLVYASKSRLKNNPSKIFISEDLTRINHGIIQSLLPLKKSGKLDSFWTINGHVYAKASADDKPTRLHSSEDVERWF